MLALVLPGLYYDAAEGTQVQWFLQVGSQDWGGERGPNISIYISGSLHYVLF